jgi:hypothetical protein
LPQFITLENLQNGSSNLCLEWILEIGHELILLELGLLDATERHQFIASNSTQYPRTRAIKPAFVALPGSGTP